MQLYNTYTVQSQNPRDRAFQRLEFSTIFCTVFFIYECIFCLPWLNILICQTLGDVLRSRSQSPSLPKPARILGQRSWPQGTRPFGTRFSYSKSARAHKFQVIVKLWRWSPAGGQLSCYWFLRIGNISSHLSTVTYVSLFVNKPNALLLLRSSRTYILKK